MTYSIRGKSSNIWCIEFHQYIFCTTSLMSFMSIEFHGVFSCFFPQQAQLKQIHIRLFTSIIRQQYRTKLIIFWSFVSANNSHERTNTNSVLIHFSVLPDSHSLSVALSHKSICFLWRCNSSETGHEYVSLYFIKILSTVGFGCRYFQTLLLCTRISSSRMLQFKYCRINSLSSSRKNSSPSATVWSARSPRNYIYIQLFWNSKFVWRKHDVKQLLFQLTLWR